MNKRICYDPREIYTLGWQSWDGYASDRDIKFGL